MFKSLPHCLDGLFGYKKGGDQNPMEKILEQMRQRNGLYFAVFVQGIF